MSIKNKTATLMVVTRSENAKLSDGKIGVAATYREVGATCPQDCALLGKGCYAQKGNVAVWQRRSKARNDSLDVIAETDTKLVRHHVSGDMFLNDKLDTNYLNSMLAFHWKNPGIQGWTYTHRWRDLHRAGYLPEKMPPNLAVLASCDTEKEMRAARQAGWRTARVAAKKSDRVGFEAVCRYQLDGTNCSQCKLCWIKNPKVKGIMFIKH